LPVERWECERRRRWLGQLRSLGPWGLGELGDCSGDREDLESPQRARGRSATYPALPVVARIGVVGATRRCASPLRPFIHQAACGLSNPRRSDHRSGRSPQRRFLAAADSDDVAHALSARTVWRRDPTRGSRVVGRRERYAIARRPRTATTTARASSHARARERSACSPPARPPRPPDPRAPVPGSRAFARAERAQPASALGGDGPGFLDLG
jgi:hypothetical protein